MAFAGGDDLVVFADFGNDAARTIVTVEGVRNWVVYGR
jgi:hypothetical protein